MKNSYLILFHTFLLQFFISSYSFSTLNFQVKAFFLFYPVLIVSLYFAIKHKMHYRTLSTAITWRKYNEHRLLYIIPSEISFWWIRFSFAEESIVIIFVTLKFKNRYYSSQFNLAILKVKMLKHLYIYLRASCLNSK